MQTLQWITFVASSAERTQRKFFWIPDLKSLKGRKIFEVRYMAVTLTSVHLHPAHLPQNAVISSVMPRSL